MNADPQLPLDLQTDEHHAYISASVRAPFLLRLRIALTLLRYVANVINPTTEGAVCNIRMQIIDVNDMRA